MIELRKVGWSKEAQRALVRAISDEVIEIERQVRTGESELWRVNSHGYIVTRYEVATQKELVLIAGAGFAKASDGVSYIETVKAFCNIAKEAGADSVRVHTEKKSITRILSRLGFSETEIVLRMNLSEAGNG